MPASIRIRMCSGESRSVEEARCGRGNARTGPAPSGDAWRISAISLGVSNRTTKQLACDLVKCLDGVTVQDAIEALHWAREGVLLGTQIVSADSPLLAAMAAECDEEAREKAVQHSR